VFRGKEIRRVLKGNEWLFSVVDVIAALTESENPAVYWRVLKKRLKDEGADQTVTKCNAFKMPADDGKLRLADMADTETMFRLIQSIPSRKAEPFKRWLARVGYERVQEIEDPELGTKRTRALYKKLKGLKRENLRDHFNDLEQIFSMLGEAATTEITRTTDAQGFIEAKGTAHQGGEVAGKARKDLESKTGRRIVSKQNYLQQPENRKLLKGNQ
jgi:prophage antirepressor-like protein